MDLKPCSAVVLASLMAFSPLASSENYSNIDEFVVTDVSLGDTAEQVIEKLTKFYSISRDDLDIGTAYSSDAIEYIEFKANGAKVIAYTEPNDEKEDVLVILTTKYDQPIEDFDSMTEKFIKEYGSPSVSYERTNRASHSWCEVYLDDQAICDETKAEFTLSGDYIFLGTYR